MVKKRLCAHSHTEVCWSSLMDWNPLTWEGQGEGLLQFFQVSKNGQSSRHPTGLCGHSTYIKAVTHLQFHKHLRSKDVMAGGCGKQYCVTLSLPTAGSDFLRELKCVHCRFGFPRRIASKSSLQEWPQRVCSAGSGSVRKLPQRVPSENGLKECVLQVLVSSENGFKECVLQVLVPSENGLRVPSRNGFKEFPQRMASKSVCCRFWFPQRIASNSKSVLQVLIPSESCLRRRFSKLEMFIWRCLLRARRYKMSEF